MCLCSGRVDRQSSSLALAGGVRGTGADTGLVDTESRPCGRGAGHPRIPHSLTTRVSPLRAGRGFGMSAQVRGANLTCDVRGVLCVFWWWAMASTGRGGEQTGPRRGGRVGVGGGGGNEDGPRRGGAAAGEGVNETA